MKRETWGQISGIVGIVLNILLFLFKIVFSKISNSISLEADAFNNLMDILSSVVIVFGFKISSFKADREHPFGHGRMEQIAGLIISILIIFTGFELFKSSVVRIIKPEALESGVLLYIVLIVAIIGKCSITAFNFIVGKKIDSTTLVVNARDSASDIIATSAVLLSVIVNDIFHLNIDGISGLVVSLMILYAGIQAALETINPLIGENIDKNEEEELKKFILLSPMVQNVHEIAMHSYGVRKKMITLHVEADGQKSLSEVHSEIDRLERNIIKKFGYRAMIHVDPVNTADNYVQSKIRSVLERAVNDYSKDIKYTDFNCALDGSYMYCDIYAPFELKKSGKEIRQNIETYIRNNVENDIDIDIAVNRF